MEGDSLGDVSPLGPCSLFLQLFQHLPRHRSSGAAWAQEFKGYVFKIMGGQDKEGFPMKQGVLTPGRVRLLMAPGDKCFRGYGRKNGERRRKTVRGCIVSNELAVLNLMIVKKGEPTAALQRSSSRRGQLHPADAAFLGQKLHAQLLVAFLLGADRR